MWNRVSHVDFQLPPLFSRIRMHTMSSPAPCVTGAAKRIRAIGADVAPNQAKLLPKLSILLSVKVAKVTALLRLVQDSSLQHLLVQVLNVLG